MNVPNPGTMLPKAPNNHAPKPAPIALNAALPGGSLNTNTFKAKSINPPIKGILFATGLTKFFVNLINALLPPLPKTLLTPVLANLVTPDLANFFPAVFTASVPNFLRAAFSPNLRAYLLITFLEVFPNLLPLTISNP